MKSETVSNWSLLAALRWVLASIVVAVHLSAFTENPLIHFVAKFGGSAAVCGFLIVSGYSIRHSIEKNRDGYLMRRIHRIYPVYIAGILLSLVPFAIKGFSVTAPAGWSTEMPDPTRLLSHLFFLQGIAVTTAPWATFDPAWTLAVEVAFYLAAPLLLKCKRSAIWWVIGFSVLLIYVDCLRGPVPYTMRLFGGSIFIFAWAWLLGWQAYDMQADWEKTVLLVAPVVLVGAFREPPILSTLTMAASVLLILNQNRIELPHKIKRIAVYAGELSYPLYLLHTPMIWIVWAYFHTTAAWVHLASIMAACVIVYHVIDKPLRKPRAVRHRVPAIASPATAEQ